MEHKLLLYVAGELDPSEQVEVERRMKQDQDLLIEAESLKLTLQKVNRAFPHRSAPEEILEGLRQKAAQKSKSATLITVSRFWSSTWLKVAAAALIAFVLGGVLSQQFIFNSLAPNAVNTNGVAPVASQGQPWNDQQGVITIQNMKNVDQAELDSTIKESMRKLVPVKESPKIDPVYTPLQLTRSPQN